MKKIVSKIHKIVISIMVAIFSGTSKILAVSIPRVQVLYGPAPAVESSKPSIISILWIILKIVLIPMALLIGLIVYWEKSKSSKKKKILISIVSIIITAILVFVIEKILIR